MACGIEDHRYVDRQLQTTSGHHASHLSERLLDPEVLPGDLAPKRVGPTGEYIPMFPPPRKFVLKEM